MKSIPGGNYILKKKAKLGRKNVEYTIYFAKFIKYEYCNEK